MLKKLEGQQPTEQTKRGIDALEGKIKTLQDELIRLREKKPEGSVAPSWEMQHGGGGGGGRGRGGFRGRGPAAPGRVYPVRGGRGGRGRGDGRGGGRSSGASFVSSPEPG